MAHILLAEDHEPTAKLTRLILSRWGHTVTVAHTGQKALAYAETNTFDLALIDVQLPEVDGYIVIEQLSRRCAVVGFTAYAEPHVARRLMDLGARNVIVKPFDALHLKGVIEKCLDAYE